MLAAVPILVARSASAQVPAPAGADAADAAAANAAAPPAASVPEQPPPPVTTTPPPPPAAVDSEAPKTAPVRRFEPAPQESQRSIGVIIPFLGIHSFQNDSATNLDAGLRLGVLTGGRVSDVLSLGGEGAVDFVNPNNVPSGVNVTAFQFHVAFSPLLHATSSKAEFVIGPKLGWFWLSEDASGGGQSASSSAHGYLYGLNIGAFGAINDTVSLGGLVSFDFERATEVCLTVPGSPEACTSSGLDNTAKVLGVTLALLF
jgi:hypothetical protein